MLRGHIYDKSRKLRSYPNHPVLSIHHRPRKDLHTWLVYSQASLKAHWRVDTTIHRDRKFKEISKGQDLPRLNGMVGYRLPVMELRIGGTSQEK